jgi:hypothetical protein
VSEQALSVGDRLVVVPRHGERTGQQVAARVLACQGSNLLRLSWSLDGDVEYAQGNEFLVIGRDFRRRALYLSGDHQSANFTLRESSGDGRSNRRFARVESVLKYRWSRVATNDLEVLEQRVRDAVGSRQRASAELALAPKTQLGDYLDRRLGAIEEMLKQVLAKLEEGSAVSEGFGEALCDLSGSGMVFLSEDGGWNIAVAFTSISTADQETIVRYNFQVERARRRKISRAETVDLSVIADALAAEAPAPAGSGSSPVTIGDHIEVSFILPMDVPREVQAVARVVRVDARS